MSKKNITNRSNRTLIFWVSLLAYVTIGTLLAFTWYRYQINPDGTSYISIAQSYAHFHIRQAINGYWGPLLSWVMVPLLWAHLNPIIAIKLINVASGAFILVVLWYVFAKGAKTGTTLNILLLLGIAPLLLVWAMVGPLTPDLLFSLMLLSVTLLAYKFTRTLGTQNAVYVGSAGGLLYYTKSIGFYIFIFQLGLLFIFLAISHQTIRKLIKPFLIAAAVFLLFISPFVATISIKYHKPIISTTSNYNHGTLAPQFGGNPSHPVNTSGPFAPPHPQSYSAWEDPSFLPVPRWSTFSHLHYVFSLIHKNLSLTQEAVFSFGPLAITGSVVSIAAIIVSLRPRRELSLSSTAGLAILLVVAGYASLVIDPRYLWCIVPLAFVALAYFLQFHVASNILTALTLAILVALGVWSNTEALVNNRDINKSDYQLARALGRYLPPRSKITADTFTSIYTCYFDNLACYGIIAPSSNSATNQKLDATINKLGITYFVDYGSVQPNPQLQQFLKKYAYPYKTVNVNGTVTTIYRYR